MLPNPVSNLHSLNSQPSTSELYFSCLSVVFLWIYASKYTALHATSFSELCVLENAEFTIEFTSRIHLQKTII